MRTPAGRATPLHAAAEEGDAAQLQALLESLVGGAGAEPCPPTLARALRYALVAGTCALMLFAAFAALVTLAILLGVILLTAQATGGIGLRAAGGSSYGGKNYLLVLGAMVLSTLKRDAIRALTRRFRSRMASWE